MRKKLLLIPLLLLILVSSGVYIGQQKSEAQEYLLDIMILPGETLNIDTTEFPDGVIHYNIIDPLTGEIASTGSFTVNNSSVARDISEQYNYYLVPWIYTTEIDQVTGLSHNFWTTKYPNEGNLDLRTIQQYSIRGGTEQCCALIATQETLVDTVDVTYIASSLSERIPLATLTEIGTRLSIPLLSSGDLSSLAYELLVSEADPTGQVRWRPLIPNQYKVVYANLGKVRLFTNRVGTSTPEWQNILNTFRYTYDRMAERNVDTALKQAGYWKIKYGVDVRSSTQILRDGQTIDPQTTYTESWTCANSDSPDCDLDWTEVLGDWDIVSNQLTKTLNGHSTIRAESDLSSDDHFAEIECSGLADFNWCGIMVRFDSGADTGYYYRWDNDGVSNNLFRRSAGVDTELTTGTNDYCAAACGTITLKLDVSGNDLETFYNGASRLTYTDSSSPITGNVNCGIYGFHSTPNLDNFTCEDAEVAPSTRRVLITLND